jgi:hypothetical protein
MGIMNRNIDEDRRIPLREKKMRQVRVRAFTEGMPLGAQRTGRMALDWMAARIVELESAAAYREAVDSMRRKRRE